MDLVVAFIHRTRVEYLQDPWHNHSGDFQCRAHYTVDLQLLIACLLRVKRIRRKFHIWEIDHAVKDAIFYAKRIEEHGGFSPTDLLEELDASMRKIWSMGISAGRPDDYDKDPGYALLYARFGKIRE
jgi:hypothetical protein